MAGFSEEPAAGRNDYPDVERQGGGDAKGDENPKPDPQALPPEKFVQGAEAAAATPGKAGVESEFSDEPDMKKPASAKVSFFALFKYADAYDYLLMTLAFFGAVGDGSSFAIMLAALGSLINSFGNHANGTSKAKFDQKVIDASATTLPSVSASPQFVCVCASH